MDDLKVNFWIYTEHVLDWRKTFVKCWNSDWNSVAKIYIVMILWSVLNQKYTQPRPNVLQPQTKCLLPYSYFF